MKKLICFCMTAALFSGCIFSCSSKKPGKGSNVSEPAETTAATTEAVPANNTAKPFLGKWEAYKVFVNDETYETTYEGFSIPRLMKLEVFDDNTAKITTALNPHGKDKVEDFKWNITSSNGIDTLHVATPDDRYDCTVEQGQMIMKYANFDDGSLYYLMPVSEFSPTESTTEAGLDNVDFSSYMGRWESDEIISEDGDFTDTIGEYPVNVAFRLELFDDNTSVMSVFGEPITYQWEAETKEKLYMWDYYEGFVIKKDGDKLVIDNEQGVVAKLHKVDEFTEYDFAYADGSAPDENIILNPEGEEEPTT
ncbi:hypothetical protein [Ruminococcus flavefaciens]|uniref:hypothetical protein n=1 Tax=Ruminococcus flavefaciens TaxID=1265 RepID=UPI00031FBB1E|nr:hypothetical protein [Ruminococcus flavefaciens]